MLIPNVLARYNQIAQGHSSTVISIQIQNGGWEQSWHGTLEIHFVLAPMFWQDIIRINYSGPFTNSHFHTTTTTTTKIVIQMLLRITPKQSPNPKNSQVNDDANDSLTRFHSGWPLPIKFFHEFPPPPPFKYSRPETQKENRGLLLLLRVHGSWMYPEPALRRQHFTWNKPCNNQRVLPAHHFCGY